MQFTGHGTTHVGRRRRTEDAYCADTEIGLYAVADGMGGYAGGDVASRTVIETIHSFFQRAAAEPGEVRARVSSPAVLASRMQLAIRMAHREVCRRSTGRYSEMGSTIAAVLIQGTRALVAHAGDSRVYRLRNRRLEQITLDHSLYEEMRAAGVPGLGATRAHHNAVTRAIGLHDRAEPEICFTEVERTDRFLLCSDGLSDIVGPDQIERMLLVMPTAQAASSLVSLAFERGGTDNITAVVVGAKDGT